MLQTTSAAKTTLLIYSLVRYYSEEWERRSDFDISTLYSCCASVQGATAVSPSVLMITCSVSLPSEWYRTARSLGMQLTATVACSMVYLSVYICVSGSACWSHAKPCKNGWTKRGVIRDMDFGVGPSSHALSTDGPDLSFGDILIT